MSSNYLALALSRPLSLPVSSLIHGIDIESETIERWINTNDIAVTHAHIHEAFAKANVFVRHIRRHTPTHARIKWMHFKSPASFSASGKKVASLYLHGSFIWIFIHRTPGKRARENDHPSHIEGGNGKVCKHTITGMWGPVNIGGHFICHRLAPCPHLLPSSGSTARVCVHALFREGKPKWNIRSKR